MEHLNSAAFGITLIMTAEEKNALDVSVWVDTERMSGALLPRNPCPGSELD
jgi:hypothetical protein